MLLGPERDGGHCYVTTEITAPPGVGQRNIVRKLSRRGSIPNSPVMWDGGWGSCWWWCCPEKSHGEGPKEMLPVSGSSWRAPGASHDMPRGRGKGEDHVQGQSKCTSQYPTQLLTQKFEAMSRSNPISTLVSNQITAIPWLGWCSSGLISSNCRWGQCVEKPCL